MYKATNIDTDKALEAIREIRREKSHKQRRELNGIQKYYEGLEEGLELAESLFECSNYEKEEPETVHTKIQYKNHEYSISEFCQRMEKLERQLSAEKQKGEENESDSN